MLHVFNDDKWFIYWTPSVGIKGAGGQEKNVRLCVLLINDMLANP